MPAAKAHKRSEKIRTLGVYLILFPSAVLLAQVGLREFNGFFRVLLVGSAVACFLLGLQLARTTHPCLLAVVAGCVIALWSSLLSDALLGTSASFLARRLMALAVTVTVLVPAYGLALNSRRSRHSQGQHSKPSANG